MTTSGPPVLPALYLLTLAEAAKALRRYESGVRARVKSGQLPVVRFGNRPGSRLYFDLADLRKFIEAHKSPGGQP